jgi:hypothetical protein
MALSWVSRVVLMIDLASSMAFRWTHAVTFCAMA